MEQGFLGQRCLHSERVGGDVSLLVHIYALLSAQVCFMCTEEGCYILSRQSHEGLPLQIYLTRLTSWRCNLCDKHGDHTFTSHKQLRHHLRSTHGRDLCAICTKVGNEILVPACVVFLESHCSSIFIASLLLLSGGSMLSSRARDIS